MARPQRQVYIQCLPVPGSVPSRFQQHLLGVREDLATRLRQLGVAVVDSFQAAPSPAVLVLFQSTGRIGDELPAALKDLDTGIKDKAVAFAAIQDDEYSSFGRDVLPPDFQPPHLLNFCVVPGSSHLKECKGNDAMLRQVAQVAGVEESSSDEWWNKKVFWSVIAVAVVFLFYTWSRWSGPHQEIQK